MNEIITASLVEGNVTLLFQFPRQLVSSYEKKMIEWVVDFSAKYGQPPTVERLESEFEHFVPLVTRAPLGDVYDRTLARKRNIYTREYILGIQEELKKGADPLLFIGNLYNTICAGSSDVVRYSTYDRSSYYRKPTSTPYGIAQLDRYTGGISQGDLVYTVGRLGTGKTTFSLWLVNKWIQDGKKVLMVSNENRADDVIVKIDSFIGGFNPIRKRTKEWSEDDLHRLRTVSFIASHMEGEMLIPSHPVKDTKELYSLVYTYKPDIVVIDGIYLMQGVGGDSHWEKLTQVSRSLKQLAEGEGVPIFGIHQANRNAIGRRMEIEHVAYADALAQDADLVLGINPEDDGSLFVECLKSRWGKSGWGMFLRIYFESMTVKVMEAPATAELKEE